MKLVVLCKPLQSAASIEVYRVSCAKSNPPLLCFEARGASGGSQVTTPSACNSISPTSKQQWNAQQAVSKLSQLHLVVAIRLNEEDVITSTLVLETSLARGDSGPGGAGATEKRGSFSFPLLRFMLFGRQAIQETDAFS